MPKSKWDAAEQPTINHFYTIGTYKYSKLLQYMLWKCQGKLFKSNFLVSTQTLNIYRSNEYKSYALRIFANFVFYQ